MKYMDIEFETLFCRLSVSHLIFNSSVFLFGYKESFGLDLCKRIGLSKLTDYYASFANIWYLSVFREYKDCEFGPRFSIFVPSYLFSTTSKNLLILF